MQTVNTKLLKLFTQADKIVLKEAERLARAVLINNPEDATEFMMYNRRSNFIIKERPGFISKLTPGVKLKGYQQFYTFMERWDTKFNIAGNAMSFTAYGKKVTDW